MTTVSVLLTNLPAPQLTYGETFSALHNAEITAGLTPVQPGELATALPGTMPLPTTSSPSCSPSAFWRRWISCRCFSVSRSARRRCRACWSRSGVTSSVADQRRSTAWGLLFVALFVMTAPAMAAFAKLIIFRDIALAPASALPRLAHRAEPNNICSKPATSIGDGAIGAAELLIARDGIALALPAAAGLPYVLIVLMATAAMAIALAASASHLFTLGGEPGRGPLPRARPQPDAAPADRRLGGDCRDRACRRRLSR